MGIPRNDVILWREFSANSRQDAHDSRCAANHDCSSREAPAFEDASGPDKAIIIRALA
jgi:hypothetical protein